MPCLTWALHCYALQVTINYWWKNNLMLWKLSFIWMTILIDNACNLNLSNVVSNDFNILKINNLIHVHMFIIQIKLKFNSIEEKWAANWCVSYWKSTQFLYPSGLSFGGGGGEGGREAMDHRTPISWENKITVFITAGPFLVFSWKLVGSLRFLKFLKYPEPTLLWFWFLFLSTNVGTWFGLNWFQRTRYSECKEPAKCQLGGKVNRKELGYLEQSRQFW